MTISIVNFDQWIRTSSTSDFWFLTGIPILLSIVCFFYALRFVRRKRVIEDIPTSKIRSAAQGYVELAGHGHLMEGQPIVSPLSGTTCTWYQFKVEKRGRIGKRTEWRTIKREVSDELFLIKDETGQCVIDPEGARVFAATEKFWFGNEVMPGSRPSLKQQGKWSIRNVFTFILNAFFCPYRYTEKLLHPNETLYAIGFYKTIGGTVGSFDVNEHTRELIREWKADTETMLKKFDSNKDGEIDMNEWQNIREAAYKIVMEKHRKDTALPPVNLMSNTHDRRRPFILSAFPQKNLTGTLQIYSILLIVFFIFCSSLATWIISLRLEI